MRKGYKKVLNNDIATNMISLGSYLSQTNDYSLSLTVSINTVVDTTRKDSLSNLQIEDNYKAAATIKGSCRFHNDFGTLDPRAYGLSLEPTLPT